MRGGIFDSIAAGVVCAVIIGLTYAFISQMQAMKSIMTTEAQELMLIRAIYIDEFARNYVKYGMPYILNDSAYLLIEHGGLPVYGSPADGKLWINITEEGNIIVPSEPIMKNETIPMDIEDKVVYYQWCTNITPESEDCEPQQLVNILDEETYEKALNKSIGMALSESRYIPEFKKFADMPMSIEIPEAQITFSQNQISMTGKVHVLVTISNGGVNSTQTISSGTETPLMDLVSAARYIAGADPTRKNPIEEAVESLDCSKTDNNELAIDFDDYIFAAEGGDLMGFSYKTNSTINREQVIIGEEEKICTYVNTLHLVNETFRFRTEVKQCKICS